MWGKLGLCIVCLVRGSVWTIHVKLYNVLISYILHILDVEF